MTSQEHANLIAETVAGIALVERSIDLLLRPENVDALTARQLEILQHGLRGLKRFDSAIENASERVQLTSAHFQADLSYLAK